MGLTVWCKLIFAIPNAYQTDNPFQDGITSLGNHPRQGVWASEGLEDDIGI